MPVVPGPLPYVRLFVSLPFLLLSALPLPSCDGDGPFDTPTDSPTPIPNAQVAVEVISATEVDLELSLSVPHAVTLTFGINALDNTRAIEVPAAKQVFHLYGLEPSATYQWKLTAEGAPVDEGQFVLPSAPTGPFKVVFDNAHAQQAGNADWVIDNDAPQPSPSNPSDEADWRGAYSAWGFDLYRSGRYTLTTNKKAFTDDVLAGVDALIVPEPNKPFTSSEISALQRFVEGGGGLFLMANHPDSDRDNDGWDAFRIWQDALADFDPPTGISMRDEQRTDDPCSNLFDDALDPVLNGPFGEVRYMGFNAGSLLDGAVEENSTLQGLVWPDSVTPGPIQMWALRARYGKGRIVAISDSSPADDGTGQSGDELYDSWNVSDQQNDAFHLNATAWLVGDVGL